MLLGAFAAGIALGQPYGPCTVETIVGNPTPFEGDGGPATEASLFLPSDLAAAPDGSIVIADYYNHRVRRIGADGIIHTIAGNGQPATSGDGGPAVEASAALPNAVAVGPDGIVYFVESGRLIRAIRNDGTIETVAGNGESGDPTELGPARETPFRSIRGLAVAPDGSVFFTDSGAHRVFKLADGMVEIVAGKEPPFGRPDFGGDGGPATEADLNAPWDVAIGPEGSVLFADSGNRRIRRVSSDGIITTVAGSGAAEGSDPAGEIGKSATEVGVRVLAMDIDAQGRLYASGLSGIRIIEDGLISAFWETDGIAGSLAAASDGSLIYGESAGRIFRRSDAESVTLVAGKAIPNPGSTTNAARVVVSPTGLGFDRGGNLLFSTNGRVYRRTSDGQVNIFAGAGERRVRNVEGPATESLFWLPRGVASDSAGNVYITDLNSVVVRRVTPDGNAEIFAGEHSSPEEQFSGSVPATSVRIRAAHDVVVDSKDNVYIAEADIFRRGQRLLRVDTEGMMTVVIPEFAKFAGERFRPLSLEVDSEDNVYIYNGDSYNGGSMVLRTKPDGTTGVFFNLNTPASFDAMALGPDGSLYFSGDPAYGLIRVGKNGRVESLTRARERGFNFGEGEQLSEVSLSEAAPLAIGPNGELVLGDQRTDTIRVVHQPETCRGPAPPILPRNAVVNGASFAIRQSVAPGEIISLFGWNLGPENLALTSLDSTGRLATGVGGTRVLFDGIPAPVVFALAGQTSVVVPYEVSGSTAMLVELDGVPAARPTMLAVTDAAPGIFTLNASGQGQAAALNQDGTLNSAENPAARGSVVVLYGTGEGRTIPALATGEIVGADLPVPIAEVSAWANRQPAEVLYIGGSPGLVAGVFQANIRLPAQAAGGEVEIDLAVGQAGSNIVTVQVE